jgi:hypothetical protein
MFAFIASGLITANAQNKATASQIIGNTEFKISFPAAANEKPLTGRMFLVVSHTDSVEPRLQVGRYGTQFFGVDFENLRPAQEVTVNGSTLGYPVNDLKMLPAGDYFI